jgi:hypothetical protein
MAAHTWWRILITANNSDTYCALDEIEMRTTPGGVDQCIGGTAIASSSYTGDWGPDNCFDDVFGGGQGSSWSSATGASFPHWIGYHFSSSVEITEVLLAFPMAGDGGVRIAQSPRDFAIQWSDDGITWTTTSTFRGLNPMAFSEKRIYSLAAPQAHAIPSLPHLAPGAIAGPPSKHILHNFIHHAQLPPEGASPGRNGEVATSRQRDFWGNGRIEGKISIEGVPASRKVRLFDVLTGLLIAETWSRKDGHYRFDYLDPNRDFFVLTHDYVRQFNAVIADWIKPEPTAYP